MENNIFKKYDYPLKGGALLQPLIKIRGRKCECCNNEEWLKQPINLQVHHIDGDRSNNELSNLLLLCPNCHSYTDNFGIKNKKNENDITDKDFIEALINNTSIRKALFSLGLSDAGANYARAREIIDNYDLYDKIPTQNYSKGKKGKLCPLCGKLILNTSTYCVDCYNKIRQNKDKPTREELKNLIRNQTFVSIGEQFNVTDNAVRKWCDSYNLPRTKKEIKSYSDEDWKNI